MHVAMNRLLGAAGVGFSIVLSLACGVHAPPRASAGVAPVPRDSLEAYISKVRKLAVEAAPRKRDAVVTLEARDAELAAALAALKQNPTAEQYVRVGDAYRAAGVLDLAYSHYASARDLDSRSAASYDGLARVWRDWGLPNLGLGDARRAIYYAPASPVAYNTFGTLLEALGQRGEARRAFERALTLDPAAAYAWTNLCYAAFQAGSFESATASCRRALAIDPTLAAAHNNLGLVYAATGRFTLADAEFRAGGDEAARHYNLGIVLSATRRYADAARAFDAAARLRPSWTTATERARQARRLSE
jgi:tetratricopeptide (TPR) repeat protein